jgi:diaminopimelate epimerase
MMQHFRKMHGLGNDFVVIDGRSEKIQLSPAQLRALGNRHTGIGFDQLVVIEMPPAASEADVLMHIYNPDGTMAGACGNVTRCVAKLLLAENPATSTITVQTVAGLLECSKADGGLFTVDMGPARQDWRDIPLAKAVNTLEIDFGLEGLPPAVAVNMGNPHVVFLVEDVDAVDLPHLGPLIEHHALLPDRANVSFAQVLDVKDDVATIKLRTWERGTGITLACGSAACATTVAATAKRLIQRRARVQMLGGVLDITWLPDNHVLMTGGATLVFEGQIDLSGLA